MGDQLAVNLDVDRRSAVSTGRLDLDRDIFSPQLPLHEGRRHGVLGSGGVEPVAQPLEIRTGDGPEKNDYKFYLTFKEAEAYEIRVIAQKWQWIFKYPSGHVDEDLHVPVNQAVRLIMRLASADRQLTLGQLAEAENLPEPSTTKMKGNNSFHKIRSGDYRIIYKIHEDRLVILVVKIGHRKDVYKRLL